MKARGIVSVIALVLFASFAAAVADVNMGALPPYVQPELNSVDVGFTFLDVDYAGEALTFELSVSPDTFANSDIVADGNMMPFCDGNYATLTNCTLVWDSLPLGFSDGNAFLYLLVFKDGNPNGADFNNNMTYVDLTAPTFLSGPTLTPDANGSWFNEPILLEAECDDISGCTLSYALDGNNSTEFDGNVTFTNVDALLTVHIVDGVGNVLDWNGPQLMTDSISPGIDFNAPIENGGSVSDSNVSFTITATDTLSGVEDGSFLLYLDGNTVASTMTGGVATYTAPLGLSEGTHTLLAMVADVAGNDVNASFTFKVDMTAPILTMGAPAYATGTTPALSFSGNETLSKIFLRCDSGTFVEFAYAATIETFDITSNGCDGTQGTRTIEAYGQDLVGLDSDVVSADIYYDSTAPSKVTGIQTTDIKPDQISLNWSDATDSGSGIDEYKVYRNTTNSIPSNPTATVGESEATMSGLATCSTYFFWVRAVDNAGNEGEISDAFERSTSGCPDNNNNNNNSNSNNSNGSNNGSGGGGGGLPACDVEINYPVSVYAGDEVYLEVTSDRSYTGGLIASFVAGKKTVPHSETFLSQQSWSATFEVPGDIGKNYTIKFSTDQCGALTRTYVIGDPATKASLAATTQEEVEEPEMESKVAPPVEENTVLDEPEETAPVQEGPSLFTGLATTASGFALPVVGLLVLLGVVLVGRGFVNTSQGQSDNPMLASAARIHQQHGKPVIPARFEPQPHRGGKWKSN